MANSSVKLIDSNKRLVYKFVGDAQEARALKVDAGGLNFALNTNNQLLSGGGTRKSQYRLYLRKLIYDVNGGPTNGYVQLQTDGDVNNTTISISGAGTIDLTMGEPASINVATANSTGNVFLNTVAFSGNCSYSIIADFRKEAADYDQGQTADPRAFNR